MHYLWRSYTKLSKGVILPRFFHSQGNLNENGKKEITANKIHISTKLQVMMMMIFHLPVLFVENHSQVQLLPSVNTTFVKHVLLNIIRKAKGVMFVVHRLMVCSILQKSL